MTTTASPTAPKTSTSPGRELLLDVAIDLFLEHGFDAVSIQQIVTAAHMTKASPYYHFKNKDDLFVRAFLRLTDRVFSEVNAALAREGDLRSRLIAGLAYLLEFTNPGIPRFFEDFRTVVARMGMEEEARKLHDERRFVDTYTQMFREAAAEGLVLSLAPERAATMLESFQMGLIHMQGVQAKGETDRAAVERLATDVIDCFLNGAIAR